MQLQTHENVTMAIGALRANLFRSALTVLGIVIGITTVVTVASLLTGLRQGVVTFFEEFGPDNIFISQFSGDPAANSTPSRERSRKPVTLFHAAAIRGQAQNVAGTSLTLFIPGIVNGRPLSAKVPGFESSNISLAATTANAMDLQPREFRAGRFFTGGEAARGSKVAIIGNSVADALFPAGDAIDRTMLVDGAEYRVIGVLAAAKGGFFGENGLDRQILIPFETGRSRYPHVDRIMIVAKAYEGKRADAFEEIRGIMRKVRRVPSGAPDDFNISTPDQIVAQFDQITGLIGLVAISISGLGLLVGGIGVMNIMLVSVTERTREIGVRKAVGARRADIVLQFLMEAMTLTGIGGVIGIVFAIAVTMLVGFLVPELPSSVPIWALAAGFAVSVSVGMFFGVWPAFKAAQLDPVEALRYE